MTKRDRINKKEKALGKLSFDNPSNKEGMTEEPSNDGIIQGFNSLIKQAENISDDVESIESINKRASYLYPGKKYYGMYAGERMMENESKVLRKYIRRIIKESFNNNEVLINKILDKINKSGIHSLTYDERNYLNQFNNNNIDKNLEKWLLSDNDETFNYNNEKILYDLFEDDEDLFYNREKLIRVIIKHLNKKPFTNNADWGGAYVWSVDSEDDFLGKFIFLGDDELLFLKRELNEDEEYEDEIIEYITSPKELYMVLMNLKK
jgi:hypothetical protein